MRLGLEDSYGLIDTVPGVTVSDVDPGSSVGLEVVTTDAAGNRWRSQGSYLIGADHKLIMDDPDRPWWEMAFLDDTRAPVTFSAPEDQLRYELSVTYEQERASLTTTRHWSKDLTTTSQGGDGWLLRSFEPPEGAGRRSAMLLVPGSTGIAASAPTAALLASHGYPSGVVAYMQEEGLPTSFRRIGVESILAALHVFAELCGLPYERITVLAQSVGTSVALSALSQPDAPAVGAVILVSPSSVVWQALGHGGPPDKVSSITAGGVDLPYVPVHSERLLGQLIGGAVRRHLSRRPHSSALATKEAYAAGLADKERVAAATIGVEQIPSPMLIMAGSDDAMWPATEMARAVLERRGGRPDDELLVLEGAGHFLRPPATPTTVDHNDALMSGGRPADIGRGQRLAWDAILSRVRQIADA